MNSLFGRFQFPEKGQESSESFVHHENSKSVSAAFQTADQAETSTFPSFIENTTACLFSDAVSSIRGALQRSRRTLATL